MNTGVGLVVGVSVGVGMGVGVGVGVSVGDYLLLGRYIWSRGTYLGSMYLLTDTKKMSSRVSDYDTSRYHTYLPMAYGTFLR